MPGSQKWVSESVLDGVNLFSVSQFSCEKLKRFAPSEAVPGISDGVTTRSYIFFLSIFFLSVYYYINNATLTTTATYLSSRKHGDNGAPPLVQNHAEIGLVLVGYWQVKYCRIAEVSMHCSDAVAPKRHK
jgi:hypothetical protein